MFQFSCRFAFLSTFWRVVGYVTRWFTCQQAVTHPSSNRARCSVTVLIEPNVLTTPRCVDKWKRRYIAILYFFSLIFCPGLRAVDKAGCASVFFSARRALSYRNNSNFDVCDRQRRFKEHVTTTSDVIGSAVADSVCWIPPRGGAMDAKSAYVTASHVTSPQTALAPEVNYQPSLKDHRQRLDRGAFLSGQSTKRVLWSKYEMLSIFC